MPRLPFCLTALVAALALSSCSLNEISKMDKEASGRPIPLSAYCRVARP
ncbi:type IV pilus formation outer membrane protein [Enterobacter cloacae]|uniref:Type IV pilus formation outer membrane protein n=1 Tax=Enterobacter cloacae TaxID=550 RepID=A0A377MA38_ENTCL|nr:type IV pilus formation outer membrane protein [Enterobacter cloacae]